MNIVRTLLQWDPEARGGCLYSQTPYLSTYGSSPCMSHAFSPKHERVWREGGSFLLFLCDERFPLYTYAPPPPPPPSPPHPQILSRGCEGGTRSSSIVWWTLYGVLFGGERSTQPQRDCFEPQTLLGLFGCELRGFPAAVSFIYLGEAAGVYPPSDCHQRTSPRGEKEIK